MNLEYFSGPGGKQLAYRVWQNGPEAKGVVIITHGYAEHAGRYDEFARFLNDKQFHVYGHDHLGHGESEGTRAHVKDFDTFVEGLRMFVELVKNKNPELPVFLLGHSMGGVIAMLYAARYENTITGLILLSPALVIAVPVSGFLKGIAKFLSAVFPKMKLTKSIADDLSRDQSVIEKYKNDPLVYSGKNRARFGYILLQLEETASPEIPKVTSPVLVMHGTEDKIADPKGSRLLYENIGSDDKTLKWFNALYHELLNEPEKREVMKTIAEWLEKHLAEHKQF